MAFFIRNANLFPKLPRFILPKATSGCYRCLCTLNSDIPAMVERAKVLLSDLQLAINNQRLSPAMLQDVIEKTTCCGNYKGSKSPFGVKEDKDNLYARIDMPGVDKGGVKVWMQKDYLYFSGEVGREYHELEFPNMDYSSKRYGCRFYLDPAAYQSDKVKAVIKNGVLRIVVPKIKNVDELPKIKNGDEQTPVLNLGDLGTFYPVDVEFE